ncbi:uncharacterized protein LOC119790470 [Cyprinodon tularosa]|uniref:uncharacterized protein LOC119790470 n=1 Tax=Cyprinodon tularosa TaxID=77115 RepID=UPI0018E1E891|nr:uncharacterized protein LOC119790470 [Cyprinodon tularosa]
MRNHLASSYLSPRLTPVSCLRSLLLSIISPPQHQRHHQLCQNGRASSLPSNFIISTRTDRPSLVALRSSHIAAKCNVTAPPQSSSADITGHPPPTPLSMDRWHPLLFACACKRCCYFACGRCRAVYNSADEDSRSSRMPRRFFSSDLAFSMACLLKPPPGVQPDIRRLFPLLFDPTVLRSKSNIVDLAEEPPHPLTIVSSVK